MSTETKMFGWCILSDQKNAELNGRMLVTSEYSAAIVNIQLIVLIKNKSEYNSELVLNFIDMCIQQL